MTMTHLEGSLGNNSGVIQVKNTSEFTLPINKVTVSNQPDSNAPMTLVRPLAPQSCFPKHLIPMGE
jgi:hypothetical protein